MQAGLRFLRLLLNAAGIDTVNREVVVVARPAGKPDGALVTSAIVLSKGSQQGEAGPISAVVRKIADLGRIDNGRSLGRDAIRGRDRSFDLDLFSDYSHAQLNVQGASLSHSQNDLVGHIRLEALAACRYPIRADGQPGEAVVAFRIRQLLFGQASVDRKHFYAGAHDDSSGRVGNRSFKPSSIDLGKRCGSGGRDHT